MTIIVNSFGKTVDEALRQSLRNALEQVYGLFISSKTNVINDKLIIDKIVSVSNGNILNYKILNQFQFPNGNWSITTKVIVSINNLTSFVESNGVTVEFKGNLFSLNIEQQILNEQAEIQSITNMISLLHEWMQTSFDYSIKVDEPKSIDSENKNWEIPIEVSAYANNNMDVCYNYMLNTLKALSLNSEEVAFYKKINKNIYQVNIGYDTFYLRKETAFNTLISFLSNWSFYVSGFIVKNGIENTTGIYHYNSTNEYKEGNLKINLAGRILKNNKIIKERYTSGEILEFEVYDGYHRKGITSIIFPKSGEVVGRYAWKDSKTLEQIEKITNYTVTSASIRSNFKEGGYVIYENNGHGLVISTIDMGELRYDEAVDKSKELILNGYNDWRLPNDDESRLVLQFLYPEDKNYRNLCAYWALRNQYGQYRKISYSIGQSEESRNDVKHFTRYVRVF